MTPEPNTQKKKIPGWAKILIVLAILGVGIVVVAGVGLSLLTGFLASKHGQQMTQEMAKKGVEALIEKGIEGQGVKAQVNIDENGMAIRDEKTGQQLAIGVGQTMPEDFPKDIPVFSPSQVTGTMKMGPMTMLTLESASSVQDIAAYYQAQLPSQGWTNAYMMAPDPKNFSGLFKKDNRQVTVNVSLGENQDKTAVVLSYGVE